MNSPQANNCEFSDAVLENLVPAASALQADGTLLYVNRQMEKLTGYTREELLGQHFSLLLPADFKPVFMAGMEGVIQRMEALSGFDGAIVRKDLSPVDINFALAPILGDQTIVAIAVTAEDIGERKLEEEINKISIRELEFQKIALDRHAIMGATDADGNIISVNDNFIAITRYSAEELFGQNARILNSGYHSPAFFHDMWSTIGKGEIWQGEIRNRRKDGSFYWVESTIVPFLGNDGKPYKYVGLHADITRIKEAEENLRMANEGLEQRVKKRAAELLQAKEQLEAEIVIHKEMEAALEKEKEEQLQLIQRLNETQNQLLQSEKMASIGQLAAGVAHEINNPVGYINSNLGSLLKYLQNIFSLLDSYEQVEPLLAANPEALQNIRALKDKFDIAFLKEDVTALMSESQEGLTRVKKIVQDLKDFSHVDEAEWQWADLHKGLDSTLNVVWNEIKYNAEVVKEYGDLPDVECLPSQLNQVFMNMLVNASHAIEPAEGKERGTITLRSGQEGSQVWVEFADTGKGIAPENISRIFDPFFTTKPVGTGTGLGLSLSYSIIQKHHGRIDIASEVGKGTVFRIYLPIQQAEERA